MQKNPPAISHAPTSVGTEPETPSTLIALYASLFVVIALFAFEIGYYLHVTDYGNRDELYVAWEGHHPQCTPASPGALNFSCPLPGYNSVLLQCWTAACNFRDGNEPPMTEALRKQRILDLKKDAFNSFSVEPKLPPGEALRRMEADEHKDLSLPAGTMPAALDQMHSRDLRRRRDLLRQMERP